MCLCELIYSFSFLPLSSIASLPSLLFPFFPPFPTVSLSLLSAVVSFLSLPLPSRRYYSATILQLAGISDNTEAMWISAGRLIPLGVCALFLSSCLSIFRTCLV